jgi:hypothetical protein
MSETAHTIHNPAVLRQLGIEALTKALGPVGMVRFMRQFDMGSGNYTEEREALLSGITMEDFERFQEDTEERESN